MGRETVSRRRFIETSIGAAATAAMFSATGKAFAADRLRFRRRLVFPEAFSSLVMPVLPYADNALAPIISASTIGFHYGKHTKAYYDNINKLILGTAFEGKGLEAIVRETARDPEQVALYNNAAQAMNHAFYFAGLKPGGGGAPPQAIGDLINSSYGDFATFRTALIAAATGQFGSGWAWVVLNFEGNIEIITTSNADSPASNRSGYPLLTIDVWEHAYYLDYQNLRKNYVPALIDSLINWDFVSANLTAAQAALGL